MKLGWIQGVFVRICCENFIKDDCFYYNILFLYFTTLTDSLFAEHLGCNVVFAITMGCWASRYLECNLDHAAGNTGD
jgi:hypothetical protein